MVHSNELITTLTPVLCASPLFISSVKYLLVLQHWLLYFGICLMSGEYDFSSIAQCVSQICWFLTASAKLLMEKC